MASIPCHKFPLNLKVVSLMGKPVKRQKKLTLFKGEGHSKMFSMSIEYFFVSTYSK